MSQFSQLRNFAAAVGRMEKKLRSPAEFFMERADDYHTLAVRVARATLDGIRPSDVDPDSWERRCDEITQAIGWSLVSPSRFRLSISDPAEKEGILPPKDQRHGFEAINFDDVMKWIEAGLEGLPGGKDITPEDEKDMADPLTRRRRASVVMKAYYSGKPEAAYNRLREAIQSFLRGSVDSEPDAIMEAIAAAWETAFSDRVAEDLLDYTRLGMAAALSSASATPAGSST